MRDEVYSNVVFVFVRIRIWELVVHIYVCWIVFLLLAYQAIVDAMPHIGVVFCSFELGVYIWERLGICGLVYLRHKTKRTHKIGLM